MAMAKEAYQALIESLSSPDITEAQKADILLTLQEDYKKVWDDEIAFNQTISENQAKINDLAQAHVIAMRRGGAAVLGQQEEQKKQELSETISLEDIEKTIPQNIFTTNEI